MGGLRKERKSLCVRGHGHHGEAGDRAGTQNGESHRRSIFFSYKQNMLMLIGARKLKTAKGYDNICVREDLWETSEETSNTDDLTERTEAEGPQR